MNTLQIIISVVDTQVREELIARLSIESYDAFEEKESELIAFIKEDCFDINVLENILSAYQLNYTKTAIEEQNWNALWESNFEPVMVDNFCLIRADFHEPDKTAKYEIVITPKMSFGTGHHATTYMMVSQMSAINFIDKEVADFGTGTGVLAILAEKSGSSFVWAIDNDDWSIDNASENIRKNNCSKINIEKKEGFKTEKKFDIILANINKNVIISNADNLYHAMAGDGRLLLSGLLQADKNDIVVEFEAKGLKPISTLEKAQWISILFVK